MTKISLDRHWTVDMLHSSLVRHVLRRVLGMLLVASAIFGLVELPLNWPDMHLGIVGVFWPASGFAVAAVLLGGAPMLVGVFAGAFAACCRLWSAAARRPPRRASRYGLCAGPP
jgi:hypothetical protein